MKHYITRYFEDGKSYAEAWSQINLFGKTFRFWRRRLKIKDDDWDTPVSDMRLNIKVDSTQIYELMLEGIKSELERVKAKAGTDINC